MYVFAGHRCRRQDIREAIQAGMQNREWKHSVVIEDDELPVAFTS